MRRLLAVAALFLAGCVSVSEKNVESLAELGSDAVLVVGKIKPEEQSYQALGDALNPPLQETYFLKVPRAKRYMVKGSVTMAFALRTVSRRQAVTEQTELLFPAPLELDIRPADRALHIGTLRLHRDESHEVTKVEVRDDYARAAAEFRAKFPGAALPRKALLRR